MSVPLWVAETADFFWTTAGAEEPFPRDLRRAIARALPITIVLLPRLSVWAAESWLQQQDVLQTVSVQNRPLRACLVCRFGHGIIFVDGADAEAEQRFSLAHELAHFLRDYYLPRERAAQRLGQAVLEAFDGLRPVHTDERTAGLLTEIDVRPFVHIMERFEDGVTSSVVNSLENAADRLALELLAPWETVSREIEESGLSQHRLPIVALLLERFGLPAAPADRYSQLLIPKETARSVLLRHLGEPPSPVELSGTDPE